MDHHLVDTRPVHRRKQRGYETVSAWERREDTAVPRATLPFEDCVIGYIHADMAKLRYESR